MIKFLKYFVLTSVFVVLSACDSSSKFDDLAQAIERNKLNISSIVVEPTKNITVEINGTPCNPCDSTFLPTNQTEIFTVYGLTPDNQRIDISNRVTWSTSDSSIAQVAQSGEVSTQMALGDVDVIARYASLEGRSRVTVSSETLTDASKIIFRDNQGTVINAAPTVTMCDTYDMQVIGDFGDSKRVITHNVDWSITVGGNPTEDAKVVLNDANLGVFSSYSPQTDNYVVQAAYPKNATSQITNTQNINVVATGFGASITIAPTSQPIAKDSNYQFSASASINSISNDITNTTKWQISDPTIATVNNSGLVSAIKEGSATLTASCGTVSNTAGVTVEATKTVSSIQIEDTSNNPFDTYLELNLNDSLKIEKELLVTATYTNQSTGDITADVTTDVTALDGNNTDPPIAVLLIGATGDERLLVTAKRVGTAVLTVKYSGLQDTLAVNVIDK